MRNEQKRTTKRKKPTAPRAKKAPADYVFALDIGTRSVMGVVGTMEGEQLRIAATETVEHTKRAMIDGQIEDIEQVSKVAQLVKERLEKRLGYHLKRVCVAAAGRALRTQKASYEIMLKEAQAIDQELVCRLEAGAIESAEQQFNPEIEEEDKHIFYLVGYSVIEYSLDDYPISNLLDHKGKKVGVEVIATFLPREVVDSLYTTMHKIGLDVASLTLEPIAAINAAIPQKLRLLNLALVDIGAGTSDIAISKDGGVVAYTMATVAGDEITEAIMKKYLVDFNTAEKVKLSMQQSEEIEFQDILGFDHTVSPEEIRKEVEPVMRSLCCEISERIVNANGAAPSAVFLVGGGSKLPGMCECVAEYLKLDSNRVAIGGNNFKTHIVSLSEDMMGPEYATPLGIALSAALNLINDSFSITLNGSKAKLFRSNKLSVLDVLLMNGYGYHQLISRSGKSILIELNGEKRTVYGGHPEPAEILINGEEATISAFVKAGDNLQFKPAVAGAHAQPSLSDVVNFEEPIRVVFNGSPIFLTTYATINGTPAQPDQKLHHHDTVTTYRVVTIADFDHAFNASSGKALLVNGQTVPSHYRLAPADAITYAVSSQSFAQPFVQQTFVQESPLPKASVSVPAAPVSEVPAAEQTNAVPQQPQIRPLYHFTLNDTPIALEAKPNGAPYLFLDMLTLVDVDPTKPQGNIILRVNGKDASYTQELLDGDRIDIYWENGSR